MLTDPDNPFQLEKGSTQRLTTLNPGSLHKGKLQFHRKVDKIRMVTELLSRESKTISTFVWLKEKNS